MSFSTSAFLFSLSLRAAHFAFIHFPRKGLGRLDQRPQPVFLQSLGSRAKEKANRKKRKAGPSFNTSSTRETLESRVNLVSGLLFFFFFLGGGVVHFVFLMMFVFCFVCIFVFCFVCNFVFCLCVCVFVFCLCVCCCCFCFVFCLFFWFVLGGVFWWFVGASRPFFVAFGVFVLPLRTVYRRRL